MKFVLRFLAMVTVALMLHGPVKAGSDADKAVADKPVADKANVAKPGKGPLSLPAFSVNDAAGNTVSGGQLSQPGKWLLVYMNASCQRCDSFLHRIRPNDSPGKSKKIVVIVGKLQPSQLKAFAARYRDWAQVSWYTDRQQQAFAQLKLTGVPVTLGMRGDQIAWMMNAPHSSATFPKSALSTWLK